MIGIACAALLGSGRPRGFPQELFEKVRPGLAQVRASGLGVMFTKILRQLSPLVADPLLRFCNMVAEVVPEVGCQKSDCQRGKPEASREEPGRKC